MNKRAKSYFRQSDYVVFDTSDLPDLALECSAGDVESIKKLARSAVPEAFQHISHRSGARHSIVNFWDNLFRDRSIDVVIKLVEEKAADPWGIVGWKDAGDGRYTKAGEGWRGSLKKSRSDLAITTWGESDNQTASRCKRCLKDIGSVLSLCGWNESITNVSEWSLQEPEYSPELDYVDFGADIREGLAGSFGRSGYGDRVL
ncbi:uncharacterized protein RSE6_04972 [Rhynchosporium secalis]|uniref:Uncharacterized protein n=1 Tax=Rhynchosporium secalis TaxID=38038 RepID=A0A1E1M6M7_RHYSE|nr:uncharacterized protein RSE6_04972 [Rhynchosporium secalis]